MTPSLVPAVRVSKCIGWFESKTALLVNKSVQWSEQKRTFLYVIQKL